MKTEGAFADKTKKVSGRFVLIMIAVIFVAVVFISSAAIIEPGHTGIVITLGKMSDNVLSEGFHFILPFAQRVESISNQIKVCEVQNAEAVSKDLQAVSSAIAVNYRIAPDMSDDIYRSIGNNYEVSFLLPQVQESLKSVSAKYTAEELITLRAQVGQEIKETLQAKVEGSGIEIERFSIVNFSFSAEFNDAIEAKQVAEQNLIKTKTEQEQAIVIANAEAEKLVIAAKAEAEQKIIAANAEASAITAKATAQANANKTIAESLSEDIIEYEKLQKWDGALPKVTSGDALISFSAD